MVDKVKEENFENLTTKNVDYNGPAKKDAMTITATPMKNSSRVSHSIAFDNSTKKYKDLGGSEATNGVKNNPPDHEGSDEHGDLTEIPSSRVSNRKVKKANDSNTVKNLLLCDPRNCGTTSNNDTDKPAKKKNQGKEEEKKGRSNKVLKEPISN